MRPVTLTLRAADVELEPGIYTHYDFALLLPPAAHRDSKGRRRLRGVSRLDDISYVTGVELLGVLRMAAFGCRVLNTECRIVAGQRLSLNQHNRPKAVHERERSRRSGN
jgi:hypothetical protein